MFGTKRREEEEYVLSLLTETGRAVEAPTAGAEGRFGADRVKARRKCRCFSPARILPLQRQSARPSREFRWYRGIVYAALNVGSGRFFL